MPLQQKDNIQADPASDSELGASATKTNLHDHHHSKVGSKHKSTSWQKSQNEPDDPEITAAFWQESQNELNDLEVRRAFWQSQYETKNQGATAAYVQKSPYETVDPKIKKTSGRNGQDEATGQRIKSKLHQENKKN